MRWLIYTSAVVLVGGVVLLHNLGRVNGNLHQREHEGQEEALVRAALASGSPVVLAPQKTETTGFKTRDFELRDWMAFGSGCRSRLATPGDVSLDASEVSGAPGRYKVRLELSDYGIKPADPAFQVTPSFARECGIRLGIYPAAGKKLSSVTAEPVYRLDKPDGPKVRLRSRLFVGKGTLSRFEKWFEKTEVVHDQEQAVEWQTETQPESLFGRLQCEEPHIVGLNLSTAVFREDLSPYEVTVTLNRRSVEIMLQFSDCSPPMDSANPRNRGDTVSAQGHSGEDDAQ